MEASKQMRTTLAILITLIVSVLAPITGAFAQSDNQVPQIGDTWEVHVQQPLSVRNAPQTGDVLGTLENGVQVIVLEIRSPSGETWIRHDTNGVAGWSAVYTSDGAQHMVFENHGTAPAQVATAGLPEATLETMVESANQQSSPVGALLSALDTEVDNGDWIANGLAGGWNAPGATVNGPALFWTDLRLAEGESLPAGVVPVLTEGFWGVYRVGDGYTYNMPNSSPGGRWLKLAENAAAAPAAPAVSDCLTTTDAQTIQNESDPVVAFNSVYENRGYQFGGAENANMAVPANSLVLTGGGVHISTSAETFTEGGRWMALCPQGQQG